MNLEGITSVSTLPVIGPFAGVKAEQMADGNFTAWFTNQLSDVNAQILNADQELRKLASGETDNLHHVMLSLEQAKLSFELALQVRNKLLEGYQEVMRMQV
jgi:flagellar hook-basal body complex protein FliE